MISGLQINQGEIEILSLKEIVLIEGKLGEVDFPEISIVNKLDF